MQSNSGYDYCQHSDTKTYRRADRRRFGAGASDVDRNAVLGPIHYGAGYSAHDAYDAREKIKALNPDVLTLGRRNAPHGRPYFSPQPHEVAAHARHHGFLAHRAGRGSDPGCALHRCGGLFGEAEDRSWLRRSATTSRNSSARSGQPPTARVRASAPSAARKCGSGPHRETWSRNATYAPPSASSPSALPPAAPRPSKTC